MNSGWIELSRLRDSSLQPENALQILPERYRLLEGAALPIAEFDNAFQVIDWYVKQDMEGFIEGDVLTTYYKASGVFESLVLVADSTEKIQQLNWNGAAVFTPTATMLQFRGLVLLSVFTGFPSLRPTR